jgi:hypothetical protein
MTVVGDSMSGLGAALLPVAAALLFEELTFGGLVRLLIAPWPGSRKHGAGERARGRKEHKNGCDGARTRQTAERLAETPGCGGGR